jgi:4-amino-4-deoxy-L-arabinose transferase-like glycosyltransferase
VKRSRRSAALRSGCFCDLPSLAIVAAICLLAFGLRLHRLDAQSLWYDEALSVHLATLPPEQTIAQSAVTDHPPLHALVLGAWTKLAGRSEFAVRFVSVWFGTLAVALTYCLGRALLGNDAGIIGALLLALSAFAVWYAQETRGYSLLLALTLTLTVAFVRLANSKSASKSLWTVFVAAGVAALYTHYYAAFTLLALNVACGAGWLCKMQGARGKEPVTSGTGQGGTQHATRNTQYVLRFTFYFFLSQLAIVAAFAPWLPAAVEQARTNTTYFPGHVGWEIVVGDTLRAFATGSPNEMRVTLWGVGVFAILMAVGLFGRAPRYKIVMTTALLVVPVAAMAILAWNKPKFAPRYVIAALPAFMLLAGSGLAVILPVNRRCARGFFLRLGVFVLAAMGLLVTAALALHQVYFDPALARPDARAVAQYIAQHEQTGDAVVLVGGYQQPLFEYYAVRSPLLPLPAGLMPPAQQPLDYGAAAHLQAVTQAYRRVWLVLWQAELADPTGVVLGELLHKAARLGVGQEFHGVQLLLFDLANHAPFGGGPQHALTTRFAQPITLVGCDMEANPATPGQTIALAVYWQADGAISQNYFTFVHLLGPEGTIAAQDDRIAGADSFPTTLWKVGTLVRNEFKLKIPPDTISGAYKIVIGLYNEDGRLTTLAGQDHIKLADVLVTEGDAQ